jgi:hypothetical protein
MAESFLDFRSILGNKVEARGRIAFAVIPEQKDRCDFSGGKIANEAGTAFAENSDGGPAAKRT